MTLEHHLAASGLLDTDTVEAAIVIADALRTIANLDTPTPADRRLARHLHEAADLIERRAGAA